MNARDQITVTAAPTGVGRASGATSRFFRSSSALQATGRFFRRHLWVWPIVAALVFGSAGWLVHDAVEDSMRLQRAAELNAMVDASATAVQVWISEQIINVQLVADDDQLAPLTKQLLPLADGTPLAERNLLHDKAQEKLRSRLQKKVQLCGYVGFIIVSPDSVVIAADQDAAVGKTLTGYRREFFGQALAGKTAVSRPFPSKLMLKDAGGELRYELPTMHVVGPINDGSGSGKAIAALGLRIRPEDQFTRILQVSFGRTGETYAFDKDGLMLSQSRFDDFLKQNGLLANLPNSQSILTVQVRDPGVNIAEGQKPKPRLRLDDWPLTRPVAEAVQGKDGCDADGYRDYRGVPSVGAWRWLDKYEFGIVAEVDAAEAFRPVYILRTAFWGLMILLVLSALGIFVAMIFIGRQQRALQKAALAARQLGQYHLEDKLGAGGMGTVYKAKHAMLRRPTAVKLLDVDKISAAAVARFEREVQLTSGLTHPNTVAVFDYGRTPEGIFYYAMEYLEGLSLDDLVRRFGPLPEARAAYLLRQVCGSLAEAHKAGLVHRDVKPANIFITSRGGLRDFVKVLDFGLVKAHGGQEQMNVTNPGALMGTPLYLSPEAVNAPDAVDARADIYAVGAVGYFLLTGTPVFTGETVMEICLKHVREQPQPPSVRSGKAISADLEALLLRCLAKVPAERPADAAELLHELDACTLTGIWTAADAAEWWAEREKTGPLATVSFEFFTSRAVTNG